MVSLTQQASGEDWSDPARNVLSHNTVRLAMCGNHRRRVGFVWVYRI